MVGTYDEIVTYTFKGLLRLYSYYTSYRWKRVSATFVDQELLSPILGCASVKLHYKFDVDGKVMEGADTIPFPTRIDARSYARSFTHNHPQTIRVNPMNPLETRFFEQDQEKRW